MHSGKALDWLVVAALAWPHLLYAVIWYHPSRWLRLFPKQPVVWFSRAAAVGKVCQFSAVLFWFAKRHPEFSLQRISLLEWGLFLLLVTAGQVLNLSIYHAIGRDGVYYGCRLGKDVPWVSGWPFNVVQHPQYVGSILTVWGCFCLTLSQGQQSEAYKLAWYWTMLYVISLVQEQFS